MTGSRRDDDVLKKPSGKVGLRNVNPAAHDEKGGEEEAKGKLAWVIFGSHAGKVRDGIEQREEDGGGTYLDLLDSDLVVSDDTDVCAELLEELVEVVGKRIVVVNQERHLSARARPSAAPKRVEMSATKLRRTGDIVGRDEEREREREGKNGPLAGVNDILRSRGRDERRRWFGRSCVWDDGLGGLVDRGNGDGSHLGNGEDRRWSESIKSSRRRLKDSRLKSSTNRTLLSLFTKESRGRMRALEPDSEAGRRPGRKRNLGTFEGISRARPPPVGWVRNMTSIEVEIGSMYVDEQSGRCICTAGMVGERKR
jgi:hypothetical protein